MAEAPRTLLVLKPSSFGDIIHTLPAVARLKATWPDCRISWLANSEWIPLLEGNSDLAEIIAFPRREFRGWGGGWRALKWWRSTLAGRRFDLALDFQGLLRTALVARASGAKIVAGLSDAREGAAWLYHQLVACPRQPVHAIERYLALAETALQEREPAVPRFQDNKLQFKLPTGISVELPAGFDQGYVLLHPYSRGKGKSLGQKEILSFIRQFRASNILLLGRSGSPIMYQDERCANLFNRTNIAELIWLVRCASFVVSVDSGPAHLAAALGRPMVAMHSWSDPRRVGPYHPDAWVWKNGMLTQVRDLAIQNRRFFEPRPLDLRDEDISSIVALATSP